MELKQNKFDGAKFNESFQDYNMAIEIDPLMYDAWNNKGYLLLAMGKNDEAIKCFDKAIEINPQYVGAWNNKGLALKLLGRTSEANAAFSKAKELGYIG